MSDEQTPRDEFFGRETVTTTDVPRYAIGRPGDKEDGSILERFQGVYVGSESTQLNSKTRLLHRARPMGMPDCSHEEILLWGSHQLDDALPTFEPGTKFRAVYVGTVRTSGGHQLKQIKIEYPASAKRRPNPFVIHGESDEKLPF